MAVRRALLRDGRIVWLDEQNRIVKVESANPGYSPARSILGQGGAGRREADIMSRLPDAELAGMQGPGVVPLGQAAARGARPGDPSPNEDGYVSRPLFGSPPQNRGNGRIEILDATLGFTPQLFEVFETLRNKDDAEDLIVTLGLDISKVDPSDPLDLLPFNMTAQMEWGIGGASFSADVDWYNGVTFPINASWVRIKCRVGDTFAPLGAFATARVLLQAAVGYGAPRSYLTPTRTVQLGQILAGATTTAQDLPKFATSFCIMSQGVAAPLATAVPPNLRVQLIGGGGNFAGSQVDNTIFDWTDRTNTSRQSPMFPIPGNARRFTLTNLGGAGADTQNNTKVVFNLSL